MDLILYKNESPNNSINKVLTNSKTIDVILRRVSDLTSLELILEGGQGLDLAQYNYVYIGDLNRYYFITSLENMGGNLWRVSLEVDVLETYKDVFLNSNAKFNRSLKAGDYIAEGLQLSEKSYSAEYVSDKGLDNEKSLILTCLNRGF